MKKIVVIPTYNELENIVNIVITILKLKRNYHVLIVDDNSPDGTGKVAEDLAKNHKEVFVLNRAQKSGLGTAYIEGFKWALKNNYDLIFQMDADLSHNPEQLPWFERETANYDVILGTRYIKMGGTVNWSKSRIFISRLGNIYAKFMTGIPFKDMTSGFRCYSKKVLETIDFNKIKSKGYAFQIEMIYYAYKNGFKIKEYPIVFDDRRVGKSKLSKFIIFEAIWRVFKLRFS